ncbi:AraC family transcriptional regulator [Solimonas sp. K1W22B-7]|uniref:AraC family transcriptional regulator n=1 Tax=Solimonas sp. K1W22B-7 TaxID=2303331 RepID=UPI000E32E747|nr:AraC family transcriptional regulator [Solimonas sp. K1W22B-7]AXQ30098.1 AraC family transcriptional regulator [Solimonas sp. K1W22B-7]
MPVLSRPVDTASPATIRVGALTGLEKLLRHQPQALSSLCSSVGLDPEALKDSDRRIPVDCYLSLLEAASLLVPDGAVGLHLSRGLPFSSFGQFADIVLKAPDLTTAIQAGMDHLSHHHEGARLEFLIVGQHAICSYSVRKPFVIQYRQEAELALANVLRFGRRITGKPDWVPVAVHFEHAAPKNTSIHNRVFGAPVHFSQSFNGLVFPKALFGSASSASLSALVARDSASRSKAETRIDLPDDARRQIVRSLPHGDCSIEDCSAQLKVSVRTLQRRLADGGSSFDEMVEIIRRDLALQYLAQDHLSLTEIASLLGYAELSTFSRAFKRWTADSPRTYRRRHDMRSPHSP